MLEIRDRRRKYRGEELIIRKMEEEDLRSVLRIQQEHHAPHEAWTATDLRESRVAKFVACMGSWVVAWFAYCYSEEGELIFPRIAIASGRPPRPVWDRMIDYLVREEHIEGQIVITTHVCEMNDRLCDILCWIGFLGARLVRRGCSCGRDQYVMEYLVDAPTQRATPVKQKPRRF